jgi:hypothetical protein
MARSPGSNHVVSNRLPILRHLHNTINPKDDPSSQQPSLKVYKNRLMQASSQASPKLVPEEWQPPGFDIV